MSRRGVIGATLLPFATVINCSDFIAHRPLGYTRSRVLSAGVSIGYHVVYGYAMTRAFGAGFTLTALVLFVPHAGFWLDRLRQYTEHNHAAREQPGNTISWPACRGTSS